MKTRYGRLVLSNGEEYEGEFRNDLVHGRGHFRKLDGTVVRGLWEEGIFVREIGEGDNIY
jgi:hypothetical protein